MIRISPAIAALSLLLGISISPAVADHPATTVFEAGQDGYKVFRIPAIIQAASGELLAFCEARQGGDASEIDLVLKRSSDFGKTWGPIEVVQESDDFTELFDDPSVDITIGNPAPVVAQLSGEHPGRIWLPFTLENDRVFVVSSDDHGKTWSERREITKDVKKEEWGWYATGPVHSIELERAPHCGRIVIPCDHRLSDDGEDRGPNGVHTIISDDDGKTWRLGAIDATYEDGLNANETTVVELKDGSLYFNTRDQNGSAPGTRGEAWSMDGGETFVSGSKKWEKFRPVEGDVLDPPVVQCALLRAANDLILFSGPDENGPTGKGRSDLRIRYSVDEAKTWQDGSLIHTGPAAYSDMVPISEGTVGVLFEAGDPGQTNAYERIDFAVIDLKEIEKGMAVGGVSVGKILKHLGAKMEEVVSADQLENYSRQFGFNDHDGDGRHSMVEYIENGNYLTPQVRRGIFNAADSDKDGYVTKAEYVLNRIITDEAKSTVQAMDDDGNGIVAEAEFVRHTARKLRGEKLAAAVFESLDTNEDGGIVVPEYLRVWGMWARAAGKSPEERLADPGKVQTARPNLIFIVIDDAGYDDFGFTGCTDWQTPRIDSIASGGVTFTDGYVTASVCGPSRAGLITGRYQQSFGHEENLTGGLAAPVAKEDFGLPLEIPTLGNLLQEKGYATAAFGKWHSGEYEHFHPNQRGFDHFVGFLGGHRSFWPLGGEDFPNGISYVHFYNPASAVDADGFSIFSTSAKQ